MHTLYVLSVWVQILAAAVWIGGVPFLVLLALALVAANVIVVRGALW